MMKLTADFETTTDPNDCRVWLWGICDIEKLSYFEYGTDLDSFMTYLEKSDNSTIYFHNEKFDGTFILCWLFEHGFTHVEDRRDLDTKTFTTLISDTGLFYSMDIMFERKGKRINKVQIIDSLKILPFSVSEIAKSFGMEIGKEEIDYHKPRPIGYKPNFMEVEYINHDVRIVATALKTLFDQGLTKMTQASNAFNDYKSIIGKKNFERWFPVPTYDHDVRQAYKGGYTYLKHGYSEKDIGSGIVLDVNSLYPWTMYNCKLPYGEGLFFKGKYEYDKLYTVYIQMFKCQFTLKEGYIPTLQIKGSVFNPTEYLKNSGSEEVTLCLTSVDMEIFYEHYEVYNEEFLSGWKFKVSDQLFKPYIDKWMKVKIESDLNGNKGMRTLAKLMLNALYGRFALNPNIRSKIPFYHEGMIKYTKGPKETRKPIYIPVGVFITAYARQKTISSAQKCYDRFIYSDTDSLHLIGTNIPDCLEIDPTKLGAWKHESTFLKARFLRQKSYFEVEIISDKQYEKLEKKEKDLCYYIDGIRVKDKIVCSGMPNGCYQYVTWDNFHLGASYKGKLQAKNVKGGVILEDIDFTIKIA